MEEPGPLRAAMEEWDCTLDELTVNSLSTDPFRADVPANHIRAKWLGEQLTALNLDRKIHLRGLHYLLAGRATRPDGRPYTNTDENWEWLQTKAVRPARWLGYVPFDSFEDHRNDAPEFYPYEPQEPSAFIVRGGIDTYSFPSEIQGPEVTLSGQVEQRWKIVLIGEKSSLHRLLSPLATRRHADLYLPSGYISDTLAYSIARNAAEDGRPIAVLYFSDCDPAGWHMPIDISRKLQAFSRLFEMPDFVVHRVMLTPPQVIGYRDTGYELPESPLKVSETRASDWQDVMGVRQTEIDSLVALHPDLFQEIALKAMDSFWDSTITGRVRRYKEHWVAKAQKIVDAAMDRQKIREADSKLLELYKLASEINELVTPPDVTLPEIELPEAEEPAGNGTPLITSQDDFWNQCQRLIRSRDYDFS